MKPGRLPTNHPDEQRARAKLRQPSPQALRKIIEQEQRAEPQRDTPPVPPARRPRAQAPSPPPRW